MAQIKAFVLIADRYHEPEYIKEGLSTAFESESVEATLVEDVEALSSESLEGVDLLVLHRDGMNWPDGFDKPYVVWMTPEQERAVEAFVRDGGGFMPLHNSIAIYPKEGPYRRVTAGHFIHHPAVETFTVRVVDRTHPVTAGVEDYVVTDEQHFLECDADRVNVLLRSCSERGESAAGWAREYGKGRVCFLANGHTLDALQAPEYQKLLRNAIRWCLRRN